MCFKMPTKNSKGLSKRKKVLINTKKVILKG